MEWELGVVGSARYCL